MKQNDKIGIVLIGKNAKMLKLLDDTLSAIDIGHSILMVPNVVSLFAYLDTASEWQPQILFLNAKQSRYINNIQAIRVSPKYDALSIIIIDSVPLVTDVEESFAAGANIYIRQSDFRQLGKVLKKVITINWQYFRGNMNRDTFFVSL